MRLEAYRTTSGYVDRPVPYGIEERDVALQLYAAGWQIFQCADLRVFHDTFLSHHRTPEITAGTVENAVLLAWLRYPVSYWFYGILQMGNLIRSLIQQGRFAGITSGLLHSPAVVWKYRRLRKPISPQTLKAYIQLHRERHDD
jgi:hypothetical protein